VIILNLRSVTANNGVSHCSRSSDSDRCFFVNKWVQYNMLSSACLSSVRPRPKPVLEKNQVQELREKLQDLTGTLTRSQMAGTPTGSLLLDPDAIGRRTEDTGESFGSSPCGVVSRSVRILYDYCMQNAMGRVLREVLHSYSTDVP
jgi:hypothetical protein